MPSILTQDQADQLAKRGCIIERGNYDEHTFSIDIDMPKTGNKYRLTHALGFITVDMYAPRSMRYQFTLRVKDGELKERFDSAIDQIIRDDD